MSGCDPILTIEIFHQFSDKVNQSSMAFPEGTAFQFITVIGCYVLWFLSLVPVRSAQARAADGYK